MADEDEDFEERRTPPREKEEDTSRAVQIPNAQSSKSNSLLFGGVQQLRFQPLDSGNQFFWH